MSENTSPSFFKIMFPLPRISKILQIPPEFVEGIDKRAFKTATLRDCSGRAWPVKLYEKEKDIFVKDGWDQFFEANSLGHFEFVTFTYDGEKCFDVRIFGKDGIEKLHEDNASSGSSPFYSEDENKSEQDNFYDAPTRVKVVPDNGRRESGRLRKNPQPNSQTPVSQHGKGQDISHCLSNERVYQKNQIVPYRGTRELKQLGVTKSTRKMKEMQITESPEEDIAFGLKAIEYEKVYRRDDAVVKGYSTRADVQKRKRGRPVGSKKKNKGQGLMRNVSEYSKKPEEHNGLSDEIKRDMINLCDDELGFRYEKLSNCKGIVINKKSFISKFPCFEISIDLDGDNKMYMTNLPTTFVKRYFPNEKTTMILINEEGKFWEVKFYPVQSRFLRGWVQFVRDNKLKHGDLCIFELVKEKELKVYTTRLEKN